ALRRVRAVHPLRGVLPSAQRRRGDVHVRRLPAIAVHLSRAEPAAARAAALGMDARARAAARARVLRLRARARRAGRDRRAELGLSARLRQPTLACLSACDPGYNRTMTGTR